MPFATISTGSLTGSGIAFEGGGGGAGWNTASGHGGSVPATVESVVDLSGIPTFRFGLVFREYLTTNLSNGDGTFQVNNVNVGTSINGTGAVEDTPPFTTRVLLGTSGYYTFHQAGPAGGSTHITYPVNLSYWVTPTISSVTPGTGVAGDTVTVVFSDELYDTPTIAFGGTLATDISTFDLITFTCTVPAGSGTVDVVGTITYGDGTSDIVTASNAFTYLASMWQITTPFGILFKSSSSQPSDFLLPFDIYAAGILYPAGTVYVWELAPIDPEDTGYWLSIDETFAGASYSTNNSRPKDPRGFVEVVGFATGSTKYLGGFPGPSCVWNNHFVYAEGGYTVGTDSPVIRVFDGEFDRPITTLPNTSTGAVPKGIMSMIAANGTIYLSTYDTGTSSSDFTGRVFSLEVESGTLTPIGSTFTTGHIPYALAWHGGRLWCGTHRQSSTSSGKIFYFRPDIDTAWTDDYTLSTSSVAGCSSLLSYQGKLYIGTTAAAATFAKVIVRSELGVYTTSQTASGGAAVANNGFPAIVEFGGNLYASYWNNDGTPVSLIYKFDSSSWSTVYTGSSTTNIPFIGFPTDNSILLAIGGGTSYDAALLSTTNGTSWSDRSAFLAQGTPSSTGVPVFGVVMH